MAGMIGPHPGAKVEVRKAARGGWLLVQRNPRHNWNDQLDWQSTLSEAEARVAWWNARLDATTAQDGSERGADGA